LHHLPAELRPSGTSGFGGSNPMSLQAMEKLLISEALRRHKGNRSKASKQLGVNPSTLYRKQKALKIDFLK
jgi:transcriptional regulator with PAS, ATPase and Fis domain